MVRKGARKRSSPKPSPRRAAAAAARKSVPSDRGPMSSSGATFPIVGIGASAGGLEAVRGLLKELPARTGLAFVLIQHLDPRHESRLPEVLSKTTAMPVATVTESLRVEPDHVYVIPPNRDMTVAGESCSTLAPGRRGPPHADRQVFPVPRAGAGRPRDRRGAVGNGLGRHAGSPRDQGGGGHRLRPGREVRGVPRHALKRGRGRRRRPASRADRPRAGADRRSPLRSPGRALPGRPG